MDLGHECECKQEHQEQHKKKREPMVLNFLEKENLLLVVVLLMQLNGGRIIKGSWGVLTLEGGTLPLGFSMVGRREKGRGTRGRIGRGERIRDRKLKRIIRRKRSKLLVTSATSVSGFIRPLFFYNNKYPLFIILFIIMLQNKG